MPKGTSSGGNSSGCMAREGQPAKTLKFSPRQRRSKVLKVCVQIEDLWIFAAFLFLFWFAKVRPIQQLTFTKTRPVDFSFFSSLRSQCCQNETFLRHFQTLGLTPTFFNKNLAFEATFFCKTSALRWATSFRSNAKKLVSPSLSLRYWCCCDASSFFLPSETSLFS